MLIIIKLGTSSYIGEIRDEKYESISKAFEQIGHPELTLLQEFHNKIKLNQEYDLYDWDDLAIETQTKSVITEADVADKEIVGTLVVTDKKFVYCNDSSSVDTDF